MQCQSFSRPANNQAYGRGFGHAVRCEAEATVEVRCVPGVRGGYPEYVRFYCVSCAEANHLRLPAEGASEEQSGIYVVRALVLA